MTPVNIDMDDSDYDQTPQSAFGSHSNSAYNRSGKTRMGSTDGDGNRLSNMPGEGRPSLTSVTPYDDNAEDLANKVEKVFAKA